MALIKFGNGIAGIRGKIAGTVYSRVKQGNIARNWNKPVSTPTPSQTSQRARLSNAAAAWVALTPSQRDAWNELSKTVTKTNRIGETYTPSGRQIYTESNINLTIVGETPLTNAPVDFGVPSISPVVLPVVEITTGAISAMSVDNLAATGTVVIQATAPQDANVRQNLTNEYRTIFTGASSASVDVMGEYVSRYGSAAAVGDAIWFRVHMVSDSGVKSPSVIVQTIATAG